MDTPVIVVNFKGYDEASGEAGLNLAQLCETVSSETQHSIVVAPQMVDLALMVKTLNIPVFAQQIENVKLGSCTGHITPESVAKCGSAGTLLNHSENRVKLADIDMLIQRAKDLNLETIVCTNNLGVTKACAELGPDYVAIEPPELIGGDISVTTADPDIVRFAVAEVKKINPDIGVLCGAGVKTAQDVKMALELGTVGVLLASGVTKASDPKKALLDLASGFN
jgi:triosephosphate isomerase